MAQSSRYFKIDKDILLEFVYHDQANPGDYDIDVDDNGSEIKVIDTVQGDYTSVRHLIHELGSEVVNFDVTLTGAYVAIENFAARTLLLEAGKTYKFNLSALTNPQDFSTTGNSNTIPYNATSGVYTYIPSVTGEFQYKLTGSIGGKITVGNTANPLFATPDEETGNSIKTGAGTIGRYHAVNVSENKYALLDSTNNFINDPSVWAGSNEADLLSSQTLATSNINEIKYDKIRLHLRSGFNFSARGKEGFLFEVKTDRTDELQNFLTQIVYLNTSNFEIKNPKPFVISETFYTSFIEIKIPTLVGQHQEFEDFFYGDNGVVGSSLLLPTSNYNMSLKLINNVEDNTNIDYFYTGEEQNFLVSREDEFQDFTVVVQESDNGDYFEIFGEKDNSAADFEAHIINQITNTTASISVIFDITVFENVGTGFIETSSTSVTKVADWDEPMNFRPIIKYANTATSFAIDVVMRIYNQTENTQIVKNASITYMNAPKYGARMMKVNIASTNNLTRVYNTLPDRQSTRNVAQVLNSAMPKSQIKYAPTFVERVDITASPENVTLQDGSIASLGTGGQLTISPFDAYVKFTVSKMDNGEEKLLSFTNVENVKLTFNSGLSFNNVEIYKDIDGSKGELLFQISKANAGKIRGLENKEYYLSVDNGSTETMIYKGTYSTT